MNNRPQLKISPKPLLKRFDTSDLAFCSVGKFYLQNLSDNRRKSDYLDMNLKALPLGTLMPSDSMVAEPLTQDALYKQVALEYGPAFRSGILHQAFQIFSQYDLAKDRRARISTQSRNPVPYPEGLWRASRDHGLFNSRCGRCQPL